jgi:hypothetical protein
LFIFCSEALEQVLRQLVGFARGGAVADGNQRHIVLHGQLAQRVQRAFPVVFRLVRIDHGGIHHLAGGIHHGHFDAGAQARVQAHGGALAGRGGQQQGFQIGSEDVDGFQLGFSRRAPISSVSRCMKLFTRQVQRAVSDSHLSAGRPGS